MWHYQARKKTIDGEVVYELVETFPDLNMHSEDAVTVIGDSKQDLADWLRRAALDVEKYDVIDGDKE